jgi:hypothetical protein
MAWQWKDQIYVFDDIISPTQQVSLKDQLFRLQFPWHYVPDVTQLGGDEARPAMSQVFIQEGKVRTREKLDFVNAIIANALQKLFEITGEKADYALHQSRAFLQFPLNNLRGHEYDAHHIDLPEPHLSILYYVMDADGETVLFDNLYSPEKTDKPAIGALTEKQRVTPKQGRVVVFDGYHWHTATQPRDSMRCVINSNVIAKPINS